MVILTILFFQAVTPIIDTQIILGIIGLIGTIVAGYLTYVQTQKSKKVESQQQFIESVLNRVDDLEKKYDTLNDKLAETLHEADKRVEGVRVEMRKLIDQANFELATWRDRYWKLIEDYQKLKSEYAGLSIKFEQLEKDYVDLKAAYEKAVRV
jgi:chromosome segregation ATPase